jgi:hypothetical protein
VFLWRDRAVEHRQCVRLAWDEAPVRGHAVDPVDAERPPVRAIRVPRHEVPPPPGVNEAVGLDEPAGRRAVVRPVGEAQALGIAAGAGDRGERRGVDRRAGAGVRHGRSANRVDAAAQSLRQDLLELAERADGGLLDAGDPAARRRAQPHGHRDRLLLVEQQRREGRPGAQAVAAADAARRAHRVTEAAQALHVPTYCADADFEPLGELRARPLTAGLKQREQLEEA